MNFQSISECIVEPDAKLAALAQERLDSLTKPPGSLGRLEDCARRYVTARGHLDSKVENPTILTFAGDHGVAAEGVSAFPQEVTPQMVANFANGGAAINVLSRHAGIELRVIDIGVASSCDFPGVLQRKVAAGTANFAKGPAMSRVQAEQALEIGAKLAVETIESGCTLLGTGDMGIANTTPSAALYAVFLDLDVALVSGRGTGIDDVQLDHKITVIRRAIELNRDCLTDPLGILAALGGYEIAGICGAIIGAASRRVPVVVDGFISGAAAVAAMAFNRLVKDYLFFSHLSAEAGHVNAMAGLGIKPLLDLQFRLGEGTGAAVAMPMIAAGVKVLHEMASFSEAGVSEPSKRD